MMPKNYCNNPDSCSDTAPQTSVNRTGVMEVGRKDLCFLISHLCLSLCEPSVCKVLAPYAKKATSSYKEGRSKMSPVVELLSCPS